ncbi:MAG: LamG-like jellyroll fold domain-containing protein, partial [Elusimicrobiota bacterium]
VYHLKMADLDGDGRNELYVSTTYGLLVYKPGSAAEGVLANDSDPDGDPISAVLVSGPSDGALSLNPNGAFTYTPNPAFSGTDGFTYKATDGLAYSEAANVSIAVAQTCLCTDLDGDGYGAEGGCCGPADCDDSDAERHPGAAEICNGTDDDCDGAADCALCAYGVADCAGPAGYWKFDEGTGSSVWDSIGDNHGTAMGPQWTAGQVADALSFDGSDDYVNITGAGALEPADQMTLETWIFPRATGYWAKIISKPYRTTSWYEPFYSYGLTFAENTSKPGFNVTTGGVIWNCFSDENVALNQWHHLAGTYDGANMKLYVDGVLKQTVAVSGAIGYATPGIDLIMGQRSPYASGEYFNGVIDEVALWHRALAADEIAQHYLGGLDHAPYFEPPEVTCTDDDGDAYAQEGGVCGPADCDDADDSVNPGATEMCDGIDNNCDGQIDEGLILAFYRDTDSDGYGDAASTTQVCDAPAGYVVDSTDCDDTDGAVNPAAVEMCDGVDNDCDGVVDCGLCGAGGGALACDGAVSYWRLDEGSGPTAADSTGLNHGTLVGPTWAAGQAGNALSFDGSNDYVRVPGASSLEPTEQITVETWIFPRANGFWAKIVSKPYRTTSWYEPFYSYGLTFYSSTSRPGLNLTIGGTVRDCFSDQSVTLNEWHHLAGTYDGAQMKIYVDGVLKQTFAISGAIDYATPGIDLILGQRSPYSNGEYFNGSMDEVAVWDRALSAQEILQHFNSGSNHEPYFDPANITCTDNDGDGYAQEGGPCGIIDCNDASAVSYPGAPELCDGLDNDCDGAVDEGFADADADGQADCGDSDADGDGTPDYADVCDNAAAPDGLVGYWAFDEAGGATAADSFGGNAGAVYGAAW